MASGDDVRLGLFIATFLAIAVWEVLAPRRLLQYSRSTRWYANIGLSLLSQLFLRLFFPVLILGPSAGVEARQWGLFNLIEFPRLPAVILSLLILDLIIYAQHRVFHRVAWLWRLHAVHHSDLDTDVTTAVRFHPVEMIFSTIIKMVAVILLGVPPVAVLIFEIVLSLTALFNHANIAIPVKVDRALRIILVTPDMHRVHHSATVRETNSNYGFSLPWWDFIFGTYCPQPEGGHHDMVIGLKEFPNENSLGLTKLLLLPFLKR